MPGGQFTNLKEQARSLGLETRWHKVAQAYADANQMFGDIVKVTLSSKVVGDMALMMVSQDLTVADVVNPAKDALPGIGRSMLKGDLGQPRRLAGGIAEEGAQGRDAPIRCVRARCLTTPTSTRSARISRPSWSARSAISNSLYLMYPKVFTDFAVAVDQYGPVSTLPTPSYFYGLPSGDELFVDIEKGKTLVVINQAQSETDQKGMVTMFFELNGQPRRIKVPDRAHGASAGAVRRKAEIGNAGHVGAPMPGVISTVAVAAGQQVKAGDVLLSIEAMKMETALHAEKDGTVAEVLVRAGDQIDAKDLLVVFG